MVDESTAPLPLVRATSGDGAVTFAAMFSTAETEFRALGAAQPDAAAGQLFGKPCFKIHGKAFVCFFQDAMVFKLSDEVHREALALDGAQLFDPSGKGRPMKEWVQVPADYQAQWPALTAAAHRYVSGQ